MSPSLHISIIGGGNLGISIAEGLIASTYVKPGNISVTRRNTDLLKHLGSKGVHVTSDNNDAIKKADVVILCVKPFQVKEVLLGVSKHLRKNQVLISAVTGVSIAELESSIKAKMPVFRAMPNTAISIGESMTCISHKNASAKDTDLVLDLFNSLGRSVIIEEKLMEAATIIGACGTAFAMRYIRANIQGGIEIGFSAETARMIVSQTVKGAAQLLIKNGSHPEEEIDKVTTPKGCTIAGLNEMEHNGLSSSLIKGITESYKKIAK
ncbi:MAG: pyrroline-5-carboxylate reductase [Bacteroidia bacterium]